jgi:hypothetical protein
MGEGIKDEGGDPFEWAVRTVIEAGFGRDVQEFIRETCHEEGYSEPDFENVLIEAKTRMVDS